MQLFDRGGQVVSRPTPNPSVNPGWVNNDLTQATAPTNGDPDWANAVTGELKTIIDNGTGASLSKTDVTQVYTAIIALISKLSPPGTGGQLQYVSATQLKLAAASGGQLWINGQNYAVPAGLTLSNSGLSASTLEYIYAFMSGGTTMTLEGSTTGYTLNANGVPQKTGDATRTLVGMAFMDASIHFNDSTALRNVASWPNHRSKTVVGATPSTASTASTSAVELNTAWRVEVTVWGAEQPNIAICGSVQNNTSNAGSQTVIGVDGSAGSAIGTTTTNAGANVSQNNPAAALLNSGLAEGHHVLSPFGLVSSGGGTWALQIAGSVRN